MIVFPVRLPRLPFRALTVLGLALGLSACSLLPGDHTYTMREHSAVQLPVMQASGELAPDTVKIVQITAQLIIEQDKQRQAAQARPEPAAIVVPPPHDDYRLGPGDVISVIVWDHPELTIPAGSFRSAEQTGNLVDSAGNIFYPYAGTLNVSGKTVTEVRQLLAQKLSKLIEKPQVDVRVAAYRSKRAYVVGEVAKPGILNVTDVPLTLLDAVNQLGGFTPEADHSQILLTRDGQTWRVDLQALYEEGAVEMNALLRGGDIVNVPDRQLNKVFVLGEIKTPGAYLMNKRRKTLAEALTEAGYINQLSANPRWIFVMRNQGDKPALFHLDSRTPDALLLADRFPLQPRDIIYVDAADSARWNRVIAQIQPTFSLMATISGVQYPLFAGRQSTGGGSGIVVGP
jgi:polysaccharide export outer membrane protein